MFDIITFGSVTRDIFITPKHVTVLKYQKGSTNSAEVCFPFGSKIDVGELKFLSGGGGGNTAATFAKQGLKVAYCGAVGKDNAGKELVTELAKHFVYVGMVAFRKEKDTNHSVVILNTGQDRTILAYRGASDLMDSKSIPWWRLKTKWMYLAPLAGPLCDTFAEIVQFAKQKGIKIAANPSIAQLSLPNFSEIAKHIDVLFLNQEEASFLTKLPLEDEHQIFQALDAFCPGVVVMTKGGEGVVASDNEYMYSAKPPQNRAIVDTTGAGDSFASGFMTAFIRENSNVEKAIQLGMANSVGCISAIGAKPGLLKKNDSFMPVEVTKEKII